MNKGHVVSVEAKLDKEQLAMPMEDMARALVYSTVGHGSFNIGGMDYNWETQIARVYYTEDDPVEGLHAFVVRGWDRNEDCYGPTVALVMAKHGGEALTKVTEELRYTYPKSKFDFSAVDVEKVSTRHESVHLLETGEQ
jgi:hypothetical protein